MPSSRRGDALARAALDLGYVTKAQLEEARRLQLEASETSGASPSLMDVLVERGHLTPDRARLVEQMSDDPTGRKASPSATKTKARRATTGQQRRVRHGPTGHYQRASGGLTSADKLRFVVGLVSGAIGLALIGYALTRGGARPAAPNARPKQAPPPPPPRVTLPREKPLESSDQGDEHLKRATEAGHERSAAPKTVPQKNSGSKRKPKTTPKPQSPTKKKPPRTGRPVNVPKDAVSHGGHWYALYRQSVTWAEAKKECEKLGGHLVTVTSQGESEFLVALTRKAGGRCWVGLTDERKEGTFLWITGEKVTFTTWNKNEPNDFGRGEDYAGYWGKHTWNDFPAHFKMQFVCEWE